METMMVDELESELDAYNMRKNLEAEYFAVDEHGERRMADPHYARLFRAKLETALELNRSANYMPADGARSYPQRQPSERDRKEWERRYFAVDPVTKVRLVSDPEYRSRVDQLRDRTFGVRRRDHNGRIVG
jgi:hypothetical protein